MSRKPKLNEEAMRSELSESRFFRPRETPAEESPSDQPDAVAPVVNEPPREQEALYDAPTRSETRTPVRPSVRTLTRMPFEIYRDQHSTLKRFSLEEQARGEKGSMSQMVREAIDMYIAKRESGEQ